jgi:hypothetical protein
LFGVSRDDDSGEYSRDGLFSDGDGLDDRAVCGVGGFFGRQLDLHWLEMTHRPKRMIARSGWTGPMSGSVRCWIAASLFELALKVSCVTNAASQSTTRIGTAGMSNNHHMTIEP